MLFGTIVGSLADKQGRKRACVTYCITYILSCITKHSPQYKVLMLGRILGGIATSLLFSAFESWLVAEHNKATKSIEPALGAGVEGSPRLEESRVASIRSGSSSLALVLSAFPAPMVEGIGGGDDAAEGHDSLALGFLGFIPEFMKLTKPDGLCW